MDIRWAATWLLLELMTAGIIHAETRVLPAPAPDMKRLATPTAKMPPAPPPKRVAPSHAKKSPAAQQRTTLAVLPFTLLHLAELDATTQSERVRKLFRATGKFQVVTAAETASRLRRAGVKGEGCHEVECAVEFGGALKVARVFTAQVLQLGRRSLIRVRYVDVGSAKALLAESVEFVGEPSRVPMVLDAIVAQAIGRSVAKPTRQKPVALSFNGPAPPFYTRPWFLITLGTVVAAGTAAGLVLGLRSSGPNTGGATFGF